MKKFFLIIISGFLMISFSCDNYFDDMEMQKKLTEGLVGYWPVTESPGSSSIKDYSENNVPLILVQDFTISDGKFSSALNSNGNPLNYISYTGSDLLKGKNFSTISFWINHSVPTAEHHLILSSDIFFTILYEDVSPHTCLTVNIGDMLASGPNHIRIEDIIVKPGEWYHVAAVVNGKELSLYLNGSYIKSETGTYVLPRIDSFFIGSGIALSGSAAFTGQLDEIRIYNRALSQEEIKALMEIGVE